MTKHLHIIGICGTFMGNLALLAREIGFRVTGSDLNAYPPMSDLLKSQGIDFASGYHPDNLNDRPDIVVVGNTISRSNPEVDAMLELGLDYTSGPQWLYENVLRHRKVVTVAGTHGKTTTTSMLTWILEFAGLQPGYLIGGVAQNLKDASRIGKGEWFIVEGDEYDTAYFDKRSKFIHYRPNLAILLNLEFDHADIFNSIGDIETQFQYFIRTLPSSGRVITNFDDVRLQKLVPKSAFCPLIKFSVSGNRDADWYADSQSEDYLHSKLHSKVHGSVELSWKVPGQHNTSNALAAMAAACHIGVSPEIAVEALRQFEPVRRRLELLAEVDGIHVFDDFAHHPTAIRASTEAIYHYVHPDRLIAVFEPRSNTMRMGIHGEKLVDCFDCADQVFMYRAPNVVWNIEKPNHKNYFIFDSVNTLLDDLMQELSSGDTVLFMSNGGFDNLQNRLIENLRYKSKFFKSKSVIENV